MMMINIAHYVREYRGEDGLRSTARKIGIGPMTLHRIENGRTPDLETFAKICKWMKADPAILLGFEGWSYGLRIEAMQDGLKIGEVVILDLEKKPSDSLVVDIIGNYIDFLVFSDLIERDGYNGNDYYRNGKLVTFHWRITESFNTGSE